ncbi:HAD family phosphatase [Rhodobacteraceae bacterium RKSG542]|uniref:HAD family hydrolase n=1 Tax=Pseudovibrio flavus TaxID=2529854 RepID=UPI0012BD3492|nr:HAD family phosphatase [Pseudovibrio flavus]MTI17162.1 HAD family phosphatase [Pseudovibrio flavus]
MSRPTAVVFDIGNVLIRWDPENLYKKLIPDEEERKHFLENICTYPWNLEQDRGRPWDEAIALLVEQHPEKEALIHAYCDRWEEMLDGHIEGTVAILQDLKAHNVPMYAITNFSVDKFEHAKLIFPFLADSFIDTVISGEEKLLKPDRAIYDKLLERNGLNAADLVFIDDTKANIEAAQALGMHAVHFQSPEQVREELKAMGLPV